MARKVRRLYSAFQPDNYTLDLDIDPKNMSFNGSVIIEGLKVGRPAKRITFHQKGLKVTKVSVSSISTKGNKDLKVTRIIEHKTLDELRLHFNELIYPGRYRIEIEYKGRINTQLHGIYASSFKDKSKQKYIICTQFESHHAREALPCIDEPEAKSVFNLTLRTPTSLPAVIANTEVIKSTKENGLIVTRFASSPKMSSYLLALWLGILSI
ncbi:MAG: hypothetical protein WDN66_05360 [Candidatus Saccharibacteria bacterium]